MSEPRDWDYGGQRRNMEDDSMVHTLDCQARVVWPVERQVIARHYGRGADSKELGRVLDLACGTGEILRRLRTEFSCSLAVGIDLFPGHLRHAERPVVCGDGLRLPFADASFDLVCVRHVLQALPDPRAMLREAKRVLAPGGHVHMLVEDYAAIFFDCGDFSVENHFAQVTERFLPRGTDLYQGRRAWRHALEAGLTPLGVDPVLVHNQEGDREALAEVFRHWRDGYAETLAELLGVEPSEIARRFDAMSEAVRDPNRFTSWLLFALRAR